MGISRSSEFPSQLHIHRGIPVGAYSHTILLVNLKSFLFKKEKRGWSFHLKLQHSKCPCILSPFHLPLITLLLLLPPRLSLLHLSLALHRVGPLVAMGGLFPPTPLPWRPTPELLTHARASLVFQGVTSRDASLSKQMFTSKYPLVT